MTHDFYFIAFYWDLQCSYNGLDYYGNYKTLIEKTTGKKRKNIKIKQMVTIETPISVLFY